MITWGRLTDLVNNGKGLDINSALFLVFSNKDIQIFALELNTGDPNISDYGQLFLDGIDARGVELIRIGGEYSQITEEIKKIDGLPFDRVTLYQDGDFYASFEFILKKDSFIFRADTIKDGEDLQDRWGDNIIGLTNESINRLNSEILPIFIQHILKQLLQ